MTEEEARKKWCPFVRIVNSYGIAIGNRNISRKSQTPRMCCIASECMAWRWKVAPLPARKNDIGEDIPAFGGRGFCGLAGNPS